MSLCRELLLRTIENVKVYKIGPKWKKIGCLFVSTFMVSKLLSQSPFRTLENLAFKRIEGSSGVLIIKLITAVIYGFRNKLVLVPKH